MRTPWQPIYQAIYAAYLGVIGESVIIDIDHWRHYFLILGVLWGLMAASRRFVAAAPTAAAASLRSAAPERRLLTAEPWRPLVLRARRASVDLRRTRRSVAQPG